MPSVSYRPRRSVLYMPGANPRALDKARNLDADALILDLEDAVSPDAKVEARANVVAAVTAGGYGYRELTIRVNALGSPWGRDDLAAVAGLAVDAVVIPKVESAEDVIAVANLLDDYGAGHLPLWAMIETPRGVLHSAQIAQSSERLKVLVMGTNDLAKELRVPQTLDRAGFMTSLGLCLLAARAYGKDIVDGVYIHLHDEAGFLASCEQGKLLGFDGKTLIHPGQIAVANRVFAPQAAELENARTITAAWDSAQSQGKGVVVVQGRLVEALHVQEARRLLDMALAIAARPSE